MVLKVAPGWTTAKISVEFRGTPERPHLKQKNQSQIPVGEYIVQIHFSHFKGSSATWSFERQWVRCCSCRLLALFSKCFCGIDGLVYLALLALEGFLLSVTSLRPFMLESLIHGGKLVRWMMLTDSSALPRV